MEKCGSGVPASSARGLGTWRRGGFLCGVFHLSQFYLETARVGCEVSILHSSMTRLVNGSVLILSRSSSLLLLCLLSPPNDLSGRPPDLRPRAYPSCQSNTFPCLENSSPEGTHSVLPASELQGGYETGRVCTWRRVSNFGTDTQVAKAPMMLCSRVLFLWPLPKISFPTFAFNAP